MALSPFTITDCWNLPEKVHPKPAFPKNKLPPDDTGGKIFLATFFLEKLLEFNYFCWKFMLVGFQL